MITGRVRHHPSGYMGKNRKQDTCTPPEVLEPLYVHCCGPFDLDAFDSKKTAQSVVRARRKVCHPKEDGLVLRWWGSVWANAPFAILGDAMRKAWSEVALQGNAFEAFVHGPFRSHRKYWKFFWRAQAVCYLNRVRYLGWDDDFPFPTVVVYYGPQAERFMRCMRHLGVVRPLTPWHARKTMAEVNISEEHESRLRSVLIVTIQAHPELSLVQLRGHLSLDSEDWERLINTPVGDLVAAGHALPIEATEASPVTVGPKKNGVSNGVKARVRKAPPRVTDGDALIEKYVGKKKKGQTFKTADLVEMTGLGRNSVLRKLDTFKNIKLVGAGRGAHFEVTK